MNMRCSWNAFIRKTVERTHVMSSGHMVQEGGRSPSWRPLTWNGCVFFPLWSECHLVLSFVSTQSTWCRATFQEHWSTHIRLMPKSFSKPQPFALDCQGVREAKPLTPSFLGSYKRILRTQPQNLPFLWPHCTLSNQWSFLPSGYQKWKVIFFFQKFESFLALKFPGTLTLSRSSVDFWAWINLCKSFWELQAQHSPCGNTTSLTHWIS